jgi:hypothetical protein
MNAYPVICWNNLLAASPGPDLTHSADASGYPFANLSDWRDYTCWKSSDSGTLYVKLDANPLPNHTATVDSLAIAGHNLGSENVAGLALQYSDDDSAYHDCFTPAAPPGDGVFFRQFDVQTHRYFKLVIPTYDHPPRIGVLFIGAAMEIPAYPESGFDPDGQEAEQSAEISKTGRLLGIAARFRRRELKAAFSRLPASFITESWVPFFAAHGAKPFFFAWDPEGRPEETYLVRLKEPKLEAPYERAWRSLSLTLAGMAD